MRTPSTVVSHPETSTIYGSDVVWNDATYALRHGVDGFYQLTEEEEVAARRSFGDLWPQYPGEYAELAVRRSEADSTFFTADKFE